MVWGSQEGEDVEPRSVWVHSPAHLALTRCPSPRRRSQSSFDPRAAPAYGRQAVMRSSARSDLASLTPGNGGWNSFSPARGGSGLVDSATAQLHASTIHSDTHMSCHQSWNATPCRSFTRGALGIRRVRGFPCRGSWLSTECSLCTAARGV